MNNTRRARLWGGRIGASVVGVLVAILVSMVLLPTLGQLAGSVASLGIGIFVARVIGR